MKMKAETGEMQSGPRRPEPPEADEAGSILPQSPWRAYGPTDP